MEAENEYLDLPDDSEEAFAVLHRRKFAELQVRWDNNEGGGGYYYERQYIDSMVAFDEVHNLGILTAFRNPPTGDREFGDFFQDCRRVAEVSSQKILMEAARRLKTGASNIVILDASSRQGIHALIEAIREKLNGLALPEKKRESLFNKLNSFAAELDRNRTRTEAFYAFAVETAHVAREVNDEIKPLQQTIDRIFEWLDKAAKWKDALPPWQDRKKIEGPPKRITKREDLDDDIPF